MKPKQRKILVVSDACYPELSPRAFRTTELVRELARQGHHITLVLPNRAVFHHTPLTIEGVTVCYAKGAVEGSEGSASAQRNRGIRRWIPQWVQRAILYFYCHELLIKYNPGITQRLIDLRTPFDAVLSIAYPVAIHHAVAKALKQNRDWGRPVCIAEFSDPPFRGDIARNVFPYYFRYLRQWAQCFDYFTIPVEKALPCYTPYMDRERIRIIPQGFDLTAVKRQPYSPHEVPTFAYAGRFYQGIRDPQFFLEFLRRIRRPFRFELYINHLDPFFAEMIAHAQAELQGEIILHDALPREALLERLSTMDFLVNFDNTTAHATPSKLIDYAMTGRPILSFNEKNFRPESFQAALEGDYHGAVTGIDLSQYDIRHIAAQFLELIAHPIIIR